MPQSADKKPEKYIGPDGKPKIRMVPVDKEVVKQEGAMKRMVTTQSNKADRMASTDKKGLETYKKKMNEYGGPKLSADKIKKMRTPQMNVDEISLNDLKSKISNTGMKSTKKAMGADKIKKDLEAMKAKLATEAKDPNEYDKEGDMMKSQLRQICSANEKLMQMVGDDDNLPEWVQSKVTKATDYIRSVRDYLESEKMDESVDWVCGKCNCDPCTCGEEIEEKTLTPAELKKREKIAKAIERDNPDMPMDKKMAIATATAKRVAEVSSNKLGDYMRAASKDAANSRGDARRQDKRIAGQSMADKKIRKKMGYSSTAKVPAGQNEAATSMRNMKLINKIKKSGAVKQGSMSKNEQTDHSLEEFMVHSKMSTPTLRRKSVARATAKMDDSKKETKPTTSTKPSLADVRAKINRNKK